MHNLTGILTWVDIALLMTAGITGYYTTKNLILLGVSIVCSIGLFFCCGYRGSIFTPSFADVITIVFLPASLGLLVFSVLKTKKSLLITQEDTSDKSSFCPSCGKELSSNAIICLSCGAPTKKYTGSGPIDLFKLSRFVLLFGLVLIGVGVYDYLSNLPLSAPESTDSGMRGIAEHATDTLVVLTENDNRSFARAAGSKTVVGGIVVLFAAIAIQKSAKPASG